MQRRIGISKRLRFEILRRDESTCRYCGRRPPVVVLEIDHIIPVKLGGSNDILNLVAACEDCNAGKSARPLDDISMQREQQSTIERLKSTVDAQAAILEDYESVKRAFGNQIRRLIDLWWDLAGENLGEAWRCVLEKWVKLFGFENVVKSMHAAAPRSIISVGAFAAVTVMDQKEPGTKQCYLIRGTLRKRFKVDDRYCRDEDGKWVSGRPLDERALISDLLFYMRYGVPLDDLADLAQTADSYGQFCIWAQEIAADCDRAKSA